MNNKRYQYIFIVESKNENNDSDFVYLEKTINYFYVNQGNKISPVYLNGKGNYNKKKSKIEKLINNYSGDGSFTFMCIDIDNPVTKKVSYDMNEDIMNYCKSINAELIWFKEDVEQVYWKRKDVSNSEKTKLANKFKINSTDKTLISRLNINHNNYDIVNESSNVLYILDKYMKRK